MLKRFSTLDAVFITLMTAIGLAIKPVLGPLSRLLTTLLLIPGGSIVGAIYMIWPMLALRTVRRFGAALMVGFIQGIIILISGLYGSHGVLSLITYTFPCLIIELVHLFFGKIDNNLSRFLPPALGNMSGAAIVGYYILHLPSLLLLIGLIPAFIFGGIGGLIAANLHTRLIEHFPHFNK